MSQFKVGDRVKRVRAGCTPTYGTVKEIKASEVFENTQWLLVAWDTGVECHSQPHELRPVKRERKRG